jgi:hypothetical protein
MLRLGISLSAVKTNTNKVYGTVQQNMVLFNKTAPTNVSEISSRQMPCCWYAVSSKKNHTLQKYDLDFFCSNNIFVGCTKNARTPGICIWHFFSHYA